MGIFAAYDDHELARAFGTTTLERARAYVADDRVLSVDVTAAGPRITMVEGRVQGSRSVPYHPVVTLAEAPSGGWLDARCSCPVVRLCKHAAAVMIVARESEEPGGGSADWQRRLSLLLDELDDAAADAASPTVPLALQVELPATRFARTRESGQAPPRGSLRLRPLRRGARDNWVKTGVSWHEVPHLDRLGSYDEPQRRVLADLLAAYRTATRQPWPGADSHLSVATFGSTLWPVLAAGREAGLTLVPAGLLRTVDVLDEPARLHLDVNGADGPRAHVQLGVRVGSDETSEWFAGDRLEVFGQAGHGVALWTLVDGLWDVRLARLERPAGMHARRILAAGRTLPVPGDEVDHLVHDYLPRLQRHVPVLSSDSSVQMPATPEPRLALTVTWKAVDEVHIAWSWRYRVGADDRIYPLGETRGLRTLRRPDAEAAILDALDLTDEQVLRFHGGHRREQGLVPSQAFHGLTAIAFTEDALVPLERSGQVEIEEIGFRPDFQEITDAPVIRFTPRSAGPDPEAEALPVDARTDWLDLEVIVTVGDRQVGLAALLEALTQGAERLILRDGRHLRIDRPEFAELRELVLAARELHDQPSDGVRVSGRDLGLWAELAEVGLVDEQAARWARDWLAAARALVDLDSLPEAEAVGLEASLRGYQQEGFRWLAFLWRHRLGGILADDMGLGKTLQALALVTHARADGAGPFLVVAPTSVVGTWAQEAAAFTPGLVVRTVTESRSRRGRALADEVDGADLVVTSYTLYRLEADDYVALDWGGLVVDEAQTVKNHTGKTYQSIRRLDAPFRLALTGTPMENRLMELWSLLSIVAPGLYPYPDRFAEIVANPVEKEGDQQVLDRFRRRIRPFLLRRTKDLVASDLPPKQEQVLEVQLSPAHRRLYETHLQRERQNVLGLLGDFDRQRIAIFRSLTRLRQLSLDAALVDPAYDGVASAKTEVLVDHLLEIVAEGHRALVFSQFTSFLTRVRRRLDEEGIASKYLDGRTRRRGEVIEDFKRGEGAVFLISLKAGGVGLTLTEADYVFVLDPWWNPAVEAQAVDRAHRIGQRRPVIVYRLVSSDTIEEKVMELKARKAALFAKVLDGSGGLGTPIDATDVAALLEP